MKDLLRKKWFRVWLLLIVGSPLVSFIGSYGYFYVLALLFPLAQLVGINQINKSKLNLIWLIHFPFWIYVISLDLDRTEILIAITLNSILGEILLTIIFQNFGRFIWLILNSFALAIIYGGMIISGSNDFVQIAILIVSYAIAAILLGIGLEYGFLKKKNTHYNTM
jgi:hypothetical protein